MESNRLPVDALRWGHCQFSTASSDGALSRKRRPLPSNDRRKIRAGPLLIYCPHHHPSQSGDPSSSPNHTLQRTIIALCRFRAGYFVEDPANEFAELYWDDSVTIELNQDGDNNEFTAKALPSVLSPALNNSLIPLYSCQAAEKAGDGHPQKCVSIIPFDQKLQPETGVIAAFSEVPVPLLSMTLELVSSSKPAVDTFSTPLAQSCLKRQFVGSCVVFVENQVSTSISLYFQGSLCRFRVLSVMASRKASGGKGSMLYWILPSTRITLLHGEVSEEEVPVAAQSNSSGVSMAPDPSPTASLFMETIRCIRQNQAGSCIPHTFLLTGPPGVGKSFSVRIAVNAIEKEGPIQLMALQGSELLAEGSHPTEAAQALQRKFRDAARFCCSSDSHVAMIFIDECEALLSEESVAFMFGMLLDKLSSAGAKEQGWQRLMVVAATNRMDSVPGWLRRPGRLDRELALEPSRAKERLKILESLLSLSIHQGMKSSMENGELAEIAEACVGYVPADLAALVRRAVLLGMEKGSSRLSSAALKQAMNDVGASALRDAAMSAPPKTTWDDIAGDAGGAKTALRRAVEWPRTKRQAYVRLGLVPPRGILLHGPPGCAKTTLARAAAGAAGVAFLSLSPADVYASSYVGEAEAVVRRAFTLARAAAPCILFFDEIDSILGSSGNEGHGMHRSGRGSSAEARVLSTFLNEMDGVDASKADGVLVLGATNRPSTLDAALLRPGRFDNIIYVPPPDEAGRKSILEMYCQRWKCRTVADQNDSDVEAYIIDVDWLASDAVTGSMTGAEIVGACREASMLALREALEQDHDTEPPRMRQSYLVYAIQQVHPLLSNPSILEEYTGFEKNRTV